YYLNPLVSRLVHQPPVPASEQSVCDDGSQVRAAMRALANRLRDPVESSADDGATDDELLSAWGRAGAESLWSMADMLEAPQPFAVEMLPEVGGMLSRPPKTSSSKQRSPSRSTGKSSETVLTRLQNRLLGRDKTPKRNVAQDRTVQIVACPGIYREVETVYHSILHNLREDRNLKQTDIAVLVTDMQRYRPVIQSVFDRRPGHLHYNLADFSAAGLSAFGHGVVGLFDLALESFTRSRVF